MLTQFVQALDRNTELQDRLSQAASPAQIVSLATEAGFTITARQLRDAAGDLSASYWPWSGKGFRFRRSFFAD